MLEPPVLSHAGVDYFESKIITTCQLGAASKLSRNSQLAPLSIDNIEKFLRESLYVEPEGWLLYSQEKSLRYSTHKYSPGHGLVWTPGEWLGSRVRQESYISSHYQALLLLQARDEENHPGDTVISSVAFCRDPWADVAACAAWADYRLQKLSDVLGGAYELRLTASETDLPLQRELRCLGYFCYRYVPRDDPYMTIDVDGETSLTTSPAGTAGDMYFSKVLHIRPRWHLGPGFFCPKTENLESDFEKFRKRRRNND